jgi:hypothetical protein
MSGRIKFDRRKSGGSFARINISDRLVSSVLGAAYATPRVKKVERKSTAPPTKGPDSLVLEARRLSEQVGLSPPEIRAHLSGLGHDLNLARIFNLINYTTRSSLIPARGAEPYIQPKETP